MALAPKSHFQGCSFKKFWAIILLGSARWFIPAAFKYAPQEFTGASYATEYVTEIFYLAVRQTQELTKSQDFLPFCLLSQLNDALDLDCWFDVALYNSTKT